MAGVGVSESTTTFDASRRVVLADLAAAALGGAVASGLGVLPIAAYSVALLSMRSRPASQLRELHLIIERLALVCVVMALYAPPLAQWVTGAAVAAIAAVVMRSVSDIINQRPSRAWKRALATVLVGGTEEVRRAAQLFASHPEHGVRPVATVTPGGVPTVLPNGSLEDLGALVTDHGAEHVLVVSPDMGDAVIDAFGRSRPSGVRISSVTPMAEILTTGVDVVDVRGLPFVSLAPRRRPTGAAWALKRVLDFVGAAFGLLLVLPLFLVVALAIRLDGGGPVFFRQRRVGRDGQLFNLWKFRTMVVDAEQLLSELRDENEADGPYFKIENDPRVTRVGRWLRRTSVDELPQLWNVLRGDMSLVGPRPCLPSEMESNPEVFAWRLSFCPGITGMWQVAGRSWLPVTEGLRMDLAYVEHWSLGLDLRLLARTASAALRGDRRPPVNHIELAPALSRARYLGLVDGDDLLRSPQVCDVSIVVVAHEAAGDIGTCLDSIERLSDSAIREVIVVDNASQDGTADLVAQRYPGVRLIRKRHRDGFATNANIGAVAASGRHVMLLNPDTCLFNGAIDRLVDHLDAHPEVGAVGPRLVYPDGSHQASARRFPTPMNSIVRRTPLRKLLPVTAGTVRHLMEDVELREVMEVDWLLGAVLAIRTDALLDVGGLDDGFRLYCEDIDLCWRLHEAGWGVNYLTTATVQHALGELTAKRFFTVRTIWHFRSVLRFVRVHGFTSPPGAVRAAESRRPVRRLDLIHPATLAMAESTVA